MYFMGLNLSNAQIACELDLNKDDLQFMTEYLRAGLEKKKELVMLCGEVECDELYLVAGHKGQPENVRKAGRKAPLSPT
jgi:hypothetical protein